jgi:RecA/RadA recombinase
MAKSKKGEIKIIESKDDSEFIELLVNNLNGKFINSTSTLGKESPSDIIDWIDTGSTLLNLIISNKKDGGIPVGRISSFGGGEGCVNEDSEVEIIILD